MPGEDKIYILGWNMKLMLLMRAVHDKNQIIKPKDENGWNVGKSLHTLLAQKCNYAKTWKIDRMD